MTHILHLRGLPWSAEAKDIDEFLGVSIVGGHNGIHITVLDDGRVSGECYVEVESESDLQEGLQKNKQYMGKRYIEVMEGNKNKMEMALNKTSKPASHLSEPIVKLRGLPYGCTKEDIANFFSGLKIKPNGIVLLLDEEGKPTMKGIDAFVEFVNTGIAAQAMERHKQRIGHRYVEVFKSSQMELRIALVKLENSYGGNMGMRNSGGWMGDEGNSMGGGRNMGRRMGNMYGMNEMSMMGGGMGSDMGMMGGMGNRPGPYDRPGSSMGGSMGRNVKGFSDNGGGMGGMNRRGMRDAGRRKKKSGGNCTVSMRGMPYAANEEDVKDFFKPLNAINIKMKDNKEGKPMGRAEVEFTTHQEAKMAMTRDKDNMKHRYIELFLDCDCEGDEDDSMTGGGHNRMMDRMQERRGMGGNQMMYENDDRMMMGSGMRNMSGGMQGMGQMSDMNDMGYDSYDMGYRNNSRMGNMRRSGNNMDSMSMRNQMGMSDDYMGMGDDSMGMRGGSGMGMMGDNMGGGGGSMGMRGSNMGMDRDMGDYAMGMGGKRMGGAGGGGGMYGSQSAKFTTKMLDAMAFGGRRVEGGLGNNSNSQMRMSGQDNMSGNGNNDMRRMMMGGGGGNQGYVSPYN